MNPSADSTRLLSRSGMFRVTGGTVPERSTVLLLLEESKNAFHTLLDEKDTKPKTTVDVELIGKAGGPAAKKPVDYQLGYGAENFSLGLKIDVSRGIDHALVERAAFTMLLYERALRSIKPADLPEEGLVVRPWLIEGLLEARRWHEGRGDRRLYQGVLNAGGGFTLDELFEMPQSRWEKLDGASRLAFGALSGALVMALLEQGTGNESLPKTAEEAKAQAAKRREVGNTAFLSFVLEAARFSGEMPVLLRRHFPGLNLSEKSLEKWWQLTLAARTKVDLTETFTISETEAALAEALKFRYHDDAGQPVTRPLEDWKAVGAVEKIDRNEAIRSADEALVRLSYRCFPSYRRILTEYQGLLSDFAKNDERKIEQRLIELTEERQIRKERAAKARDYLDYFEITRARDVSGAFDDYLKLKEELQERPRPERGDRLSDVLDTMDRTYEGRKKR